MNKKVKVIVGIILIFFIVLSVIILITAKNKEASENKEVSKTSNLTSTVLKISDNYVTMQDENNIIYTFLITEAFNLEVGEVIQLEYKGELNTSKEIQDNEVVSYKVLEKVSGEIPSSWLDSGLFSDFYKLAYQKLETLTLDEKIGQILLARVPTTKQIEDLQKYKFGGYLLFQRDFDSKTKNEVISMIKNYQDNANIPLLIAVDEEGGTVSRISSNKNLVETPFKSPRELYQEGGFSLISEDTILKSQILEELGINLNLAPVVDIATNPTDYMYSRSVGLDATLTSEYAKTVIEASHLGTVSYTLKHFPGYGNNADTHQGISIDTRSLETILENDIKPFEAGIKAKAEAVLVSHNIVEALDKEKPASLSISVHNLLRDDLGFTGIVITDDLSMKAITDNYSKTSVVDAILAGNDLLIVTDYEEAIKTIKQALEDKTLSEDLLDKMVFRILAFKYYKGLLVPVSK